MATKRKITGTVISNKNDKTIAVEVSGYRKHPKYKKRVQFRHRYYAHDELNEAQVGDVVTIEESRPLSALKRFRLVSIDKKAVMSVKEAEAELKEEILEAEVKAEEKAEEPKVEEVKAEEAPAKKPAARKASKKTEEPKEESK